MGPSPTAYLFLKRHRIAPDGIGQRTRPYPLDGPAKRDTGKARLSVANPVSFAGAAPAVQRNLTAPRQYFCGSWSGHGSRVCREARGPARCGIPMASRSGGGNMEAARERDRLAGRIEQTGAAIETRRGELEALEVPKAAGEGQP